MASPELATERLASLLEARAAPAPTREKRCKVVEFDPGGRRSRPSQSPEPAPTELEGPKGFVYDGVRTGHAIRAGLSRRSAATGPLPMEDVYLHSKTIDNSRCRRRVAPEERNAVRQLILAGALVVIVVLAAFGPRTALTQSGYRIGELSREHQSLSEINHQLKMRQAMLSDVRRVTVLAEGRGLTAPPPERYAWQNRTISPVSDAGELAQSVAAGIQ